MSQNDQMLEKMIQYTHPDKLLGYLPGMPGALPALFGLDPARYGEITERLARRARQAAMELLSDDAFAAKVDALPFRPGQSVLAVGDSLTDDLQSWAEILRNLLDLRERDVEVINKGATGHTSAMILRNWPSVLARRPDWIICGLGGNDVVRIGPEPAKTLVSLAESVANLTEMRRIAVALTDASWVWITPPPVLEQRVAAFAPFRQGGFSWRNADVHALAEAVTAFDEPVLDLRAVLSTENHYGPDGVHPTLDGQQAIARALVDRLTVKP
ncbi:SGNH/GDSL hydrolase family protein [Nonomuraea sp. B5E05]|uniref:SGNH/GDSL hydrolase family protein n=1 Tax=Nonomuraea sp. B5E05 TaxID=3153569 RepID=UPI0032602359